VRWRSSSSDLMLNVLVIKAGSVDLKSDMFGLRYLANILPEEIPVRVLPAGSLPSASDLPDNTIIFNVRHDTHLESVGLKKSWLPSLLSSSRNDHGSQRRLHLYHCADEMGDSAVASAYDQFNFSTVLRDYHFARGYRGTSRRPVMLGAHSCAGTPLRAVLDVFALPPLGEAPGSSSFVVDPAAALPVGARPSVCSWSGFEHGAARSALRAFLAADNTTIAAWARSVCKVTFQQHYRDGPKWDYYTEMSRAVFYLNPEGNTRALDNIRWGEIMRHAAIPVNVDTGEHATRGRATEGFEVYSADGRPPPGIYASAWSDAFQQMRSLAAMPAALRRMQSDIVAWRRRALRCIRADAGLLFTGWADGGPW